MQEDETMKTVCLPFFSSDHINPKAFGMEISSSLPSPFDAWKGGGDLPMGQLVQVKVEGEKEQQPIFLGRGVYNPNSLYRVRILCHRFLLQTQRHKKMVNAISSLQSSRVTKESGALEMILKHQFSKTSKTSTTTTTTTNPNYLKLDPLDLDHTSEDDEDEEAEFAINSSSRRGSTNSSSNNNNNNSSTNIRRKSAQQQQQQSRSLDDAATTGSSSIRRKSKTGASNHSMGGNGSIHNSNNSHHNKIKVSRGNMEFAKQLAMVTVEKDQQLQQLRNQMRKMEIENKKLKEAMMMMTMNNGNNNQTEEGAEEGSASSSSASPITTIVYAQPVWIRHKKLLIRAGRMHN